MQALQTVTLLPGKLFLKKDGPLDLNFDDKLTFMHKELQTNIINSIKGIFFDSTAWLANRPSSTIDIVQDIFQATSQQALKSKKEIESLKGQLSR